MFSQSSRKNLACVFNGRTLLQLQHDGPHAGHVFGVFVRLGVEVAQLGHALPLGPEDGVKKTY